MKNFSKLIFTAFLLLTSMFALAQETITGRVNDDQNLPLPGASVNIKGTTDFATTDIDGNFSVKTSKTSGELVVSFLGFDKKTVPYTITPDLL